MIKKILLFLSIFILAPYSLWASPLVWNSDQKAIWQKMKSENHAVYNRLKNEARGYEDYGMRDGILYLVTGDPVYAQKAWASQKYRMTANPSRNETRHQLETMALLYSWIYEALDQQSKDDFTAAMERWVNLAIANTVPNDSDELVGHYFGVALYALSIKDRNPTRYDQLIAKIGGFDATGSNLSTWRNAVKKFSGPSKGGQWIESSNYNINTTRYLFIGITAINEFFGSNKFPEYNFNEFADAHIAELTPNIKDSFQWGDNEEVRQLSKFRRFPMYTVLGGITKNPKLLWAMDKIIETGNMQGIWYLYYDPYSPRQAIADGIYNASGMGVATFKKGATMFASMMKPRTYVDHEFDMFTNFNLYEGNAWTITNPRGYYSNLYNEARYHNNLRVWGFIPTVFQKGKGQVDFQSGIDWVYHAGTAYGQAMQTGGLLPTEVLKEWTRQIVYLENEAIVIFDRINCKDPKSLGDTDFNKYRSELRAVYTPYHQWILHMPDTMTVQDGDYVWTNNGRTMRLKAFFDHDFKYEKFNGWGATPTAEDKNWLTLKTKNNSEWMTLMAVIDLTNSAIVTKLSDGKIQVNSTVITFNSIKDQPPSFSINRNSTSPPPPPPPPCVSDGSCSASVPACESTSIGIDNCGVMCMKQGAQCPVEIQEVTISITEFKKKTSYYLGLVNSGQTKLYVTYYGKPYEIRKK